MTWNTGRSILGTGDTKIDVERESDVIFTALFIGATYFQNRKSDGSPWRIDMEPNIDAASLAERTDDDRKSMYALNNCCSKVNHILMSSAGSGNVGVTWGLTPTFDRGGMILAGEGAKAEYGEINETYAKSAYLYLTASHRAARDNKREKEMYVGRGAYCGIVIDKEGNAVTAMSTIRTTLNEKTVAVGDRWRPPLDADIRAGQYKAEANSATWGIIGSDKIQELCRQQGMRFFPQADGNPIPLEKEKDIVGYTHGMIRSIYETKRIDQGNAFEMSVGTATYKLASCMSCSAFMMANGLDASSTHLGRGESWVPYYSGESHNPSYHPDKMTLGEAISHCNRSHAVFMHESISIGIAAMLKALTWVNKDHLAALKALEQHLNSRASLDNTVARDLYLDAMTIHKGDLWRLDDTLTVPPDAIERCKKLDWYAGPVEYKNTWREWKNIFTDEQISVFHTPPKSLIDIQYRLTAYGENRDDACDLYFSLKDNHGTMRKEGRLVPSTTKSKGTFDFKLNGGVDIETWTIKFETDANYGFVKLDQNTAIGSGRYRYVISALTQ